MPEHAALRRQSFEHRLSGRSQMLISRTCSRRLIAPHRPLCYFTRRSSALVKMHVGADTHQETGRGVQAIETTGACGVNQQSWRSRPQPLINYPRPLPGDRRPQAHRGAPATRPGHGRSHRLGDERRRSSAAGPVVAFQLAGNRAGTRLAVVGEGATLWLLAGGVGAPLRPQRELGVAAAGAGRVAAGSDPAASARRSDRGATGHEVSGAGGARQPGGLRADGRRFRPAPLRYAASRTTLCRLAGGLARGSRAHPRRAGTVFENAAAAAGHQAGRGRTRSRTGDGRRHPASRRPAARRSPAGDGPPATGTSAGPDRKRAPGTGPDGGANRKGTGSSTC